MYYYLINIINELKSLIQNYTTKTLKSPNFLEAQYYINVVNSFRLMN